MNEPPASLRLSREHIDDIDARVRRAVAWSCPRALRGQEDDLAQAAMMRLLKQLDRGRVLNASYVKRTVHSVLIDELRKRRTEPLPEDYAQVADPAELGPLREVASTRIAQAIRECLAAVLLSRRRAVTLHLLGHPVSEVAGLLGIDRKKADNLVYRGVSDLRSCLAQRGVTPH